MGRPIKSEPRNRQLNLSLTEGELQNIKQRADAKAMRLAHFCRSLLLGEGSRKITAEPEGNLARLIHMQLVRLGNNLNQLLRHIHRHGGPLPRDLEPLLQEIRNLISRGISR